MNISQMLECREDRHVWSNLKGSVAEMAEEVNAGFYRGFKIHSGSQKQGCFGSKRKTDTILDRLV